MLNKIIEKNSLFGILKFEMKNIETNRMHTHSGHERIPKKPIENSPFSEYFDFFLLFFFKVNWQLKKNKIKYRNICISVGLELELIRLS